MKNYKLTYLLTALFLFFSCSKPEHEALFFNIENYYQAMPERHQRYKLVKREIKKHKIRPLEFKQATVAKTFGNIGKVLLIKPGAFIFSEPFLASFLTANPEKIEFNNNRLITYDLPEKTESEIPVFNITFDKKLLFDKIAGFCEDYYANNQMIMANFVEPAGQPEATAVPFPDDFLLKEWDVESWHINPRIDKVKKEKADREEKCLIIVHNSYRIVKELTIYAEENEYNWSIYSNTSPNPEALKSTLAKTKPEIIILFSFENNRLILEAGEELLAHSVILEYKTIYSSLLKSKSYLISEDYDLLLTEGLASDELRKFILENSVKKQNFINHTVDNKDIITIKKAKSKKVLFK